ncbi:MAG: hypothetical protein ACTHU0_20190 [Kofleriaceae bacterium]
MRKFLVVATLLATGACGSKNNDDRPAGTASGSAAPGSATKPVDPPSCPPGNAIQDGACVVVVTPEKVAAIGQQKTRLDELAQLLDKVELAAAPIELMNGLRQLDQWKALSAGSEKLKVLDSVVATLDVAVKKLRAFKGSLGEAAGRLGNLQGELQTVLDQPATARRIEDLRAQVSSQIRGTIEPLAAQVADTIQNAVSPLITQLSDTGDLVIGACAMAKLSGGGDRLAELCKQAKDVFGQAQTFLTDLKGKPAQLFADVTTKIEAELGALVDEQSKKLVAAAQEQVNAALKLPPGGSAGAAGSAAGSAGSAAP